MGTGYNCIALPSHSASTPICLFNIQLSTLDLEASQQHIHGWLLQETAKMMGAGGGGMERQEKEMGRRKNKVQNVVTDTKVNKRTWWIDLPVQEVSYRGELSELDTEMPSRSPVNSFNLRLTWFYKGHPHGLLKKMLLFQQKTCNISWESRNQKISYLPCGIPFFAPQKDGSFLKLCLWAVIMNIWAKSFYCMIPEHMP